MWSAAVVALMAVLFGGGAWLWWAQKRAAAEGAIESALQDAMRLQEQRKLPQALSAARRAVGLLAGSAVSEDLKRRARELQAELEMVKNLEDIRLKGYAYKNGKFAFAQTDLAYSQAFRQYGIDVTMLDTRDAAARIREKTTRADLAAALDTSCPTRAMPTLT